MVLHHFDVKLACPDPVPRLHLPSAPASVLGWAAQLNKAAPSDVRLLPMRERGFLGCSRIDQSRPLYPVACVVVRGMYFETRAYTWNEKIRHMCGQISKSTVPLHITTISW